jgi:hypothetical protein
MKLYLLAASAGALLAGLGAWQVQGWRYGLEIAEIRSDHEAVRLSLKRAQDKHKEETDAYIKALNAARTRESVLRRDVAAATDAAHSLREQTAAFARQLAAKPAATIVDYATAAGELLADCGKELTDMAAKADGHAGDVKTLIDAWPSASTEQTD